VIHWVSESGGGHSDLTEELYVATRGFDVALWSPGKASEYPPALLPGATGRIAAIAVGMGPLLFRLPDDRLGEALAIGELHGLGPNWVAIDPFDPEVSRATRRAEVRFWASTAYNAN